MKATRQRPDCGRPARDVAAAVKEHYQRQIPGVVARSVYSYGNGRDVFSRCNLLID